MQAMASAQYDYVPSMAVDPDVMPYTPSMAVDPDVMPTLPPTFINGDAEGILTPTATPVLLNPQPTTTAILASIGENAPVRPVDQAAPASTPTVTSEDTGLTGKIALGVVGGLLILTAVFGGLYLWILRRRRERAERANEHVESRGGSAPFYAFLKVKSRNSDDAHSISSSWHAGPDGVSIWGVGGPLATPPHEPSDLGHASDIGHASSDGHGLMQDPQGGAAHPPDYIPYRGPIEPPRLPEVKSEPIVMSEWRNKNDVDARPASSNALGLTFDDKAGSGAGGMLRKFSFRRKNSTRKQAGPSAPPKPTPASEAAPDPTPGPSAGPSEHDNPFDQPIYRPRLDPIPASRVDSVFSIGSSVSGTSALSAATTINAAYNARRTTAQFVATDAIASLPDLPMPPPPARASTPSLHALNPLSPPVNGANNPHSRARTNLGPNNATAGTSRMSAPLTALAPVKLAPVPPLRRARTEATSNKGKVHFAGEPYPFVGYGPRG